MGWIHPEIMCLMHPDENQHPGVCSSCLREKLKKLPGLPFSMDPDPSPAAYYNSSSSSSVCLSPTSSNRLGHHRRASSHVNVVEKGIFVITGGGGRSSNTSSKMGKSRSVSCLKRKRIMRNSVSVKKKEGFWSKLFRSTSMKTRCVLVQTKHAND